MPMQLKRREGQAGTPLHVIQAGTSTLHNNGRCFAHVRMDDIAHVPGCSYHAFSFIFRKTFHGACDGDGLGMRLATHTRPNCS